MREKIKTFKKIMSGAELKNQPVMVIYGLLKMTVSEWMVSRFVLQASQVLHNRRSGEFINCFVCKDSSQHIERSFVVHYPAIFYVLFQ